MEAVDDLVSVRGADFSIENVWLFSRQAAKAQREKREASACLSSLRLGVFA
jgi:hypothetical protein